MCIYIYIYKWSYVHMWSTTQKQDDWNLYAIMKTMYPPGYHHNNFVVTHASCAQVHELPQSHCGDNWEGTLYSWLHIYIYMYIYLKYMRVLFSEKKDLHLVSKGVEWRNQNKFQPFKPDNVCIKSNRKVSSTAEIGA